MPVPSSDRPWRLVALRGDHAATEDSEGSPWRWTSSATITVLSGLLLVLVTLADWLISPQVAVLTAFITAKTLGW